MPNIQGPDGKVIAFPEGTSDADIASAFSSMPTPAVDMSNVAGAGPGGPPQPANFSQSPAATGVLQPPAGSTATTNLLKLGEATKGAIKSVPSTAAGIIKMAPGSSDAYEPLAAASQPSNPEQKFGLAAGNAAQFLIPGAGEEKAGLFAAKNLPRIAPLAKAGLAAVDSGILNKAQGGTFGGGAAAGMFGSGVSQAFKAWAPQVAESGLKVLGNDRMYGRTVGRAILDDTKGFTPKAVMQSAQDRIGELTPELDDSADYASRSGVRGSLSSARTGVQDTIDSHIGNRAVNTAQDIQPLNSFLNKDSVTGLPLSESQTPTGLLRMKRGVDADFVGNWNPNKSSQQALGAARSAYGNLADEFHAAVPGAKEIDQRISSLIPVSDRASRVSLAAPTTQQLFNKLAAPTGALAAPLAGGMYGYQQGGAEGAVGGAAAGMMLPAMLATPTGQMILARALNSKALPNIAMPLAKGIGLQGARSLFGNRNPESK